ncbi:MAG: integration host factor subunit beta, partial [Planctomycetes bacterium]|nr:integration host factor subunit beta [Planctomycetota bacterium]
PGKDPMTKSQLIAKLSKQQDLSMKDANTVVETVFEEIASSLENGRRIELRGFGSFGLKERRAREGRNPAIDQTCGRDHSKPMKGQLPEHTLRKSSLYNKNKVHHDGHL